MAENVSIPLGDNITLNVSQELANQIQSTPNSPSDFSDCSTDCSPVRKREDSGATPRVWGDEAFGNSCERRLRFPVMYLSFSDTPPASPPPPQYGPQNRPASRIPRPVPRINVRVTRPPPSRIPVAVPRPPFRRLPYISIYAPWWRQRQPQPRVPAGYNPIERGPAGRVPRPIEHRPHGPERELDQRRMRNAAAPHAFDLRQGDDDDPFRHSFYDVFLELRPNDPRHSTFIDEAPDPDPELYDFTNYGEMEESAPRAPPADATFDPNTVTPVRPSAEDSFWRHRELYTWRQQNANAQQGGTFVRQAGTFNMPQAGNGTFNMPQAGNGTFNMPQAGNGTFNMPQRGDGTFNAGMPAGDGTFNLSPGGTCSGGSTPARMGGGLGGGFGGAMENLAGSSTLDSTNHLLEIDRMEQTEIIDRLGAYQRKRRDKLMQPDRPDRAQSA